MKKVEIEAIKEYVKQAVLLHHAENTFKNPEGILNRQEKFKKAEEILDSLISRE